MGCLSQDFHNLPSSIKLKEVVEKDFRIGEGSESQMEAIRARYLLVHANLEEDKRIWPLDNSGEFTIKSFYKYRKPRGVQLEHFQAIWAPFIPTKISFFIWRLLHNALPIDLRIKVPMASRCSCCSGGNLEDNEHLLLKSELAGAIWKHYTSIFGQRRLGNLTIKDYLLEWVHRRRKGLMEGLFFTLMSVLILWEIWKERNRRRYEEGYKIDNRR